MTSIAVAPLVTRYLAMPHFCLLGRIRGQAVATPSRLVSIGYAYAVALVCDCVPDFDVLIEIRSKAKARLVCSFGRNAGSHPRCRPRKGKPICTALPATSTLHGLATITPQIARSDYAGRRPNASETAPDQSGDQGASDSTNLGWPARQLSCSSILRPCSQLHK